METVARRKVLVVDNDGDFAESLSDILSIEKYVIEIASSAEEAEESVRTFLPDVSLIDVRLGIQDGINLISELKRTHPRLLCIVMTAFAAVDTAVAALEKGAYDYLRKPIHPPALFAALERCFEKIALEREREEALAALKRSEELYRRFFEEDLSGDFVAEPSGSISLCNPPFASIFGCESVREALSRNLSELFGGQSAWSNFLGELGRQKRLSLSELELRRIDGRKVHVIANIIGRFGAAGELVKVNGYLMDITEHKRLEEMLRQSQKLEAIGRLAGGIAHDFNNLLTAILGYSDLIRSRLPKGSQFNEDIEEIHKAARRAASLTGQLLAFSRSQHLKPQALNLDTVILDMRKMLCRLIGEDVELVTDLRSNDATVKADLSQITQVILNLAINARDAMPRGGTLTFRTENRSFSPSQAAEIPGLTAGAYVALHVIDTGIGMSDEIKAHLFEPFFSTKELGKGTGLGLATVFGVVKQSGGIITVSSQPDQGTHFSVFLPVCTQDAELQSADAPRDNRRKTSASILLVEDESGLAKLVIRALEADGHTLLMASNGLEALEIVARMTAPPTCLITDIMMPHMGGEALAKELLLKFPDLRVLFMSGYAKNPVDIKNDFARYRVDFISKPFTLEAIVKKIHDMLDL